MTRVFYGYLHVLCKTFFRLIRGEMSSKRMQTHSLVTWALTNNYK